MADTVNFLNIRFNRMSANEAVEILLERLLKRQGGRVYYANAHTIVTAAKNPQLAEALEHSDLLLADGSGVCWGSVLLDTPLIHNLNGTDLVPALCKAGAKKGLSVYFLGAKPGVAASAAKKLKANPGIEIAGVHHGYFPLAETQKVLEDVRNASPHLLLVAMGVPLQELWINNYASQLPGITCMGVGALFDFVAERVTRAPKAFRTVGIEWLWRLANEPNRLWQRYLIGNSIFCGLVIKAALETRWANKFSSTTIDPLLKDIK